MKLVEIFKRNSPPGSDKLAVKKRTSPASLTAESVITKPIHALLDEKEIDFDTNQEMATRGEKYPTRQALFRTGQRK